MSEILRRRMENTQEDVIVALNTGLQERKIRNRAVLETIVKTVLLCGQQNLALRGHRDDSQYATKTTQNEVISIIGDSIQRSIVNDCNGCF
jgi:hypothetical protein